MVVLECSKRAGSHHERGAVTWTSQNKLQTDLCSTSPAEQREAGLLCLGRSLFILTASVNHEGNYSCSQRNVSGQSWFSLTVYNTLNRDLEDRIQYSQTCYTQESCNLYCPDVNIPDNPSFTSDGVIWRKDGSTQEIDGYFSRGEVAEPGLYICTRPYLYDGQIYNMSFMVVVDIQPSQSNEDQQIVISSPRPNEVIFVDVGSPAAIKCEAVVYSVHSLLFWLSGDTLVESNDSFPVFSNFTRKKMFEGENQTVYLVFKEVTEDNLLTNYTCKVQNNLGSLSFVTVILAKRVRPFHISMEICSLVIVAVTAAVVVVIYVQFKIEITLFLRDTLGCHRRTADGKIYDVFLMSYKSNGVTGLNPCDIKWLMNVLEENLGYKLCFYDRDVQPGKAVSEALLDCIEQSRSVVLVPSPAAPSLESGLLSTIHAALVERKTSLVVIEPESAEDAKVPVPEAIQLLDKTGHCVRWEGLNSLLPSSPFWKKLRYHLPAACTGTEFFALAQRLC
ncbi:interleukin-18 receptor 1-like isoform X2 [Syngnathoides biaculeatus]|nr:interleukin-18 receptor 1-like isoform X2 [Syngnathoides biaculeatus]XP_061669863.1 interleukin-18 receptor 1-like isoform X2 [Syngnathoides biaculeatus]XP_061669864.1 interleukin-18 receptor 1-like isoform X2 [Syngnathoides biaculeatus]XP_061669865.1 interleukin-18 receptor 1-like isoform X2 [Syngnathoides biaculeatus]XP_061669866.1 interleukin-18 receptor 1-like isoform X2 [Syngnathoides biaculeatus]XP_061669867.1 interleukin-18 receptor 1-like isoform X2 [Syngnathoides biaculeatus]XP_06